MTRSPGLRSAAIACSTNSVGKVWLSPFTMIAQSCPSARKAAMLTCSTVPTDAFWRGTNVQGGGRRARGTGSDPAGLKSA